MREFLTRVLYAGFVLVVLLLVLWTGMALRLTPEVANCDWGRKTVDVEVRSVARQGGSVSRERVLRCYFWKHQASAND